MHADPYFERLSEAYAVVDGIPDHQITLDIEQISIAQDMQSIGVSEGRYLEPSNWDALVLTPDMWLSLCPPYIDIVWPLFENRESYGVEAFWRIEGRLTSRFELAMAHLFNLSHDDAEEIFGMRSDDEADSRSDKQVFLDRITAFLQYNGQEVTVGSGHVDQQEMLEHGISLPERTTADSADALNAETESQSEEKPDSTSDTKTGFAALALESDTPGVETFDTEASATAVSPIVHEQSVEKKQEK
jgi:hypothetical protein